MISTRAITWPVAMRHDEEGHGPRYVSRHRKHLTCVGSCLRSLFYRIVSIKPLLLITPMLWRQNCAGLNK